MPAYRWRRRRLRRPPSKRLEESACARLARGARGCQWIGMKVAALALGFGVLVAFVVAEVALRLYNPIELRLRSTRIVLPTHTRTVLHLHNARQLGSPIHMPRNSLGFRGPEPPHPFAPPQPTRLRRRTAPRRLTCRDRFRTRLPSAFDDSALCSACLPSARGS